MVRDSRALAAVVLVMAGLAVLAIIWLFNPELLPM
jgi:hypothetical protein